LARRPCTFKKRDVARAVQAVQAAGMQIHRIEIDKAGKIILFAGSVVAKVLLLPTSR
jgi:hypothetical protein